MADEAKKFALPAFSRENIISQILELAFGWRDNNRAKRKTTPRGERKLQQTQWESKINTSVFNVPGKKERKRERLDDVIRNNRYFCCCTF